jgi:hypothetical protein
MLVTKPFFMKNFILVIITAILISACGPSKPYLLRNDPDKALQDAVKKLNKSARDTSAIRAVPILYNSFQQIHLAKIESYKTGTNLSRWDNIIDEYNYLQDAYDNIINSNAAFRIVNPRNYNTELLETKEAAAEDYYQLAQQTFDNQSRANAKAAYGYFKRADRYSPNYKDSRAMMQQAYESAVVNVLINPVQDNSYFNNNGWGNYGYNYSNQYFQQTLITDLQNLASSNLYAARFYTDANIRQDNIQPDWVVDLRLRTLYIPRPTNYNYRRNVSAEIMAGKDTSGKPVYQTVNAVIDFTRLSFIARATMDVNINDVVINKNISYRSFDADYNWQVERATYSGDSRAINQNDWAVINNRNYDAPRKEDVLQELYRQLYPQVKNNISYAVDW